MTDCKHVSIEHTAAAAAIVFGTYHSKLEPFADLMEPQQVWYFIQMSHNNGEDVVWHSRERCRGIRSLPSAWHIAQASDAALTHRSNSLIHFAHRQCFRVCLMQDEAPAMGASYASPSGGKFRGRAVGPRWQILAACTASQRCKLCTLSVNKY